jgi:hypothetical protein
MENAVMSGLDRVRQQRVVERTMRWPCIGALEEWSEWLGCALTIYRHRLPRFRF